MVPVRGSSLDAGAREREREGQLQLQRIKVLGYEIYRTEY